MGRALLAVAPTAFLDEYPSPAFGDDLAVGYMETRQGVCLETNHLYSSNRPSVSQGRIAGCDRARFRL